MENNFSKNFKHLRLQYGFTQEDIAKKLNKDYSTIGKWENGTRSPIMEDVIKISEIFDIPLQKLICENLINNSSQPEYKSSDNEQEYKKILKEKNLMDTNENIKLDRLQEMLDLANKVEELTRKDD